MKNYLYNDWMRIAIPKDWDLNEDQENALLTICNQENGKGALQISFITRTREEDLNKDIADQIDSHLSKQDKPVIVSFPTVEEKNNYLLGSVEYIVENRYWRVWFAFTEKKGLFITFNTKEEYKDEEIQKVNQIIDSISFVG